MKNVLLNAISVALIAASTAACAAPPTHTYAVQPHTHDWRCAMNIAQMAQVYLTNAGVIDQKRIDNAQTKARLLLKKSFGQQRYAYVYELTMQQTDGKHVRVIAESTSEGSECPSQDVKVYVISKALGHLPSMRWTAPDKEKTSS